MLQLLAKIVLIPLGLTTAASAAYTGIQKKSLGSETTRLIISNKEMKGIMKIIKSLEGSDLLIKSVSEMIQNESMK